MNGNTMFHVKQLPPDVADTWGPGGSIMDAFVDFLLDYNRKVNLVSRQSTPASLKALISETLLLKDLIASPLLIDAGSGSGLLGIPLAIALPAKEFILVEAIRKKAVFLNEALRHLKLANVAVHEGALQEFMHRHFRRQSALAARGFPGIATLADYVYKGKVRELLLISSAAKIEKIAAPVAQIRKTRYNIPTRDNLLVFKMENVSRETR
jgi:16S rRNA (guanine527-N7)-methyltransferase